MDDERCFIGKVHLAALLAEAVVIAYDLAGDLPELDGLAQSVLHTADLAELALEIEGEPFGGIEDRTV